MKKIAAIVLAAGKGKRMNSADQNKVSLKVAGKQLIVRTIDLLDQLQIEQKIVVVGFAKESVVSVLGDRVTFAEQNELLGTADAVSCGLEKLSRDNQTVLVLDGDDSAFYEKDVIKNLIKTHDAENAAMTFLTIDVDNPEGLGRVIRDRDGQVLQVVEEKDLKDDQRKIHEINPGCYIFEVSFLKKYLGKVEKSPETNEYYLTSLVDIAINNKERLIAFSAGEMLWRGVNTPEELKEAETLFLKQK
jgi:bifunctional N-acetylglucosamine-1-phosphate-uridyltransferase/glucosamine-1-phosphate-acetyltransferase GlmU-like protein